MGTEATKISIKTVVVVFNVNNINYYTYQNVDQGLSDATNVDTALIPLERHCLPLCIFLPDGANAIPLLPCSTPCNSSSARVP